jgi:hypothetical protein
LSRAFRGPTGERQDTGVQDIRTQDTGAHDHSRAGAVLTKCPVTLIGCPVAGLSADVISALIVMNKYSLLVGKTHAIRA